MVVFLLLKVVFYLVIFLFLSSSSLSSFHLVCTEYVIGCDMEEAIFESSTIIDTDLSFSKLRKCCFYKANLNAANFSQVDGIEMDARLATFEGCLFLTTNLEKAFCAGTRVSTTKQRRKTPSNRQ